ncbi:hypothetical protein BJP40_01555 [Streptomyces sp. CC53]|nr:hypothetical protein BJP40_01555 [Streptomyces sp. CC53]
MTPPDTLRAPSGTGRPAARRCVPRRILPRAVPGATPTAAGPVPAGTAGRTTGAPGRGGRTGSPKDHVPRLAEPRSEAGNGVRSDA